MTELRSKILWSTIILIGSILFYVVVANGWIVLAARQRVVEPTTTEARDCAIVLGAGVLGEKLSGMLKGRMEAAIHLYKNGLVKRVLVTGYGTERYYNETYAMKRYALRQNIPESAIITDVYGKSTFESLSRAKNVYQIQSAFILSQDFHLDRAVWIAVQLGIDAKGYAAGNAENHLYYNAREVFARSKDFFLTYLSAFELTANP